MMLIIEFLQKVQHEFFSENYPTVSVLGGCVVLFVCLFKERKLRAGEMAQ